jgi:cytochrome P450
MTTGVLASPDTFSEGVPHDLLTRLRATEPVSWQDMEGEPGFWAVLRHADVVHVAREPNLFSASQGGVVLEDLEPDSLEMMRGMLLAMDPPRHTTYRRPIADSFKAKIIGQLESQIRDISRGLIAEAGERGEVEFVHEVASGLPSRVMGQLMGLPEQDWAHLHELSERQTSGQDPDVLAGEEPDYSSSIEMAMYAIEFATERRAGEPQEDLTTLILDGDFGGQPMSEVDFGSFFVQLVTAGNDTTKTMLSSGLHALLTHPDQLADLRADPSLIPGAVEEILRWANPLHYFRRTATADTVVGQTPIAEGDKVAMYYTSANRDEAVFADSQAFDIHRSPNPHLSFGIAEHFCLGVHLARLEGRVFFTELLAAFDEIELTGDPVHLRSNLNNGFKRLPVRFGSPS